MQQEHDLRKTRGRDVAQPGKFAVASDWARPDQSVKLVRQREEPRDSGRTAVQLGDWFGERTRRRWHPPERHREVNFHGSSHFLLGSEKRPR